jgi:hypothetical protein
MTLVPVSGFAASKELVRLQGDVTLLQQQVRLLRDRVALLVVLKVLRILARHANAPAVQLLLDDLQYLAIVRSYYERVAAEREAKASAAVSVPASEARATGPE